MEIRGNFEEVKNKILDEYRKNDVELISILSTVKAPDLTIEEVTKLYAQLRYLIDKDIVIRLTHENELEILYEGRIIPMVKVSLEVTGVNYTHDYN